MRCKTKEGFLLARKDKSFAAYLEDQYYDLMFKRLKSFIFQNRGGLNLHTSLVPDPSYTELDDLHVMGVSFKETEDDRILFRAAVQADVIVKGHSRRDYEEDIVYPWFSISFTGILRCGLNMVTITSVGEYSKERFSKEDALSQYLIPYVYSKDLDAHAEKFPGLCTPDESYHGLTYTKAFGKGAYITKATAQLMRDLGSIQSPQNSFLLNLGLETLHLRMPQHCRNAQKVAEYLSKNEKVAWVNYCGLPDNKYYSLAQKYMPNGSCGVISFGLKGGRDVSIKFMDSLEFIAIVTHVADARSCVLHPASHTHRQLSDEQLMEAGVRPDLIRLSVGIENADDIIADIEQALNA